MRVLATYGIKGGVGKTSAAVNLAALAAGSGRRTLVWDLDPQGAAGFLLGVEPKGKDSSARLLTGKREPGDAVRKTGVDRLSLLAADVTAREADRHLEDAKKPTRALRRLLEPLADDYDLAVLDCPPSLSLLSENVFAASHLLLVPLVPAPLSLRTFVQLQGVLAEQSGRRPAVRGMFSMVDGRKRLHTELLADRPADILQAVVPMASAVERMGVTRRPVVLSEPAGRAALAYRAVWDELQPLLA